ncbi:hypothetical protein BDW75DRAFT_244362 [Aspergillus navahoensis]
MLERGLTKILLLLLLHTAPTAKVGGMISTNFSDTSAVLYGTMHDWRQPDRRSRDGSVIKTRQGPRKSSAGCNLNDLFVGSEGTLRIIAEHVLLGSVSTLSRDSQLLESASKDENDILITLVLGYMDHRLILAADMENLMDA